MSQQKQYMRWTSKENQKLIDAVNLNKSNSKNANWSEVQLQFPNHTQQQLKSQYRNLKNAKPTLYHTWSEVDETILYLCVQNYGQDWELISQTYFPNVSVASLKSKYRKYCALRIFIHQVFQALNTDQDVSNISTTLLLHTKRHLDMFDNRVKLLKGLPMDEPDDYDRFMGLNSLDVLERKNAAILAELYDVIKLQTNMYAELRKRGLMK
ncbi:Myb-like_DNA-binding domain-containing protein [Hexamita inflata]|uniref:Myb-like_DNA-binding domain-containing protein n=1 Tax=Hexamita inflata TaxID=28002 RepID=A0ABP1GLE8_9EUKA